MDALLDEAMAKLAEAVRQARNIEAWRQAVLSRDVLLIGDDVSEELERLDGLERAALLSVALRAEVLAAQWVALDRKSPLLDIRSGW